MVRIFGLHQNNRYFAQCLSRTIKTIRSVVSFSVRSETHGRGPIKKSSRLPSNYTSYRKHEQRSKSDSRIKKTSQLPRGSGPREARLAKMALSQLAMALRGEPNLRIKFRTMASPNINKRACRETEKHTLMMIGGKQIGGPRPDGRNQDGSGTTKSEDFFGPRISYPRSGNFCVCDGWCTHTPCRTHLFLTHFPCVACRHRVHAWLKVFAVRMSHISPSHHLHSHVSSAVFAVPALSLRDHIPVCTVFAGLHPGKRTSARAAGVWQPGRSHALHISASTWPFPS